MSQNLFHYFKTSQEIIQLTVISKRRRLIS